MAILLGHGVTKRFGGLNAVENLDFHVEAGEILALIGPNGAGKTTLVNLITGILPIDRGEIWLKDERIDGLPPHQRNRRGVARTFQVVKPFRGLTVRENVLAGALFGRRHGASRPPLDRAEEVLRVVGLAAKADVVAERLTIPDKKRVELARALATRPEVLLLDEVMSGLTPSELDEMMALVRRINGDGVTIVLIEHVMRAVMGLSSRIVVLQSGRKIAEGAPEQVAADETVIRAYLGRAHERR